ncbi:MAG: DNA polymerase Y family protein [Burkholderiales bacterium]|nr:DNA polymerase Y family protein [Burkholderiales bacterium]
MLWLSLIPCTTEASPEQAALQQRLLSWWALQFSPRVAVLEESVVIEASASLRLFGGEAALRKRMLAEASSLGFRALSWAPTSLGALALSRHGGGDGMSQAWSEVLNDLPLDTLSAVATHRDTLARLGCRSLGDVRRLPRSGMARRFGADLLDALDQAYGLRPETHAWVTLPEVFDERLELPGRVESSQAVLLAAGHLLARLQGWLSARHAGVRAIVLRWRHDMPSRAAGDGGEVEVRTAEPVRAVQHLGRLLGEHLAKIQLKAPVGELSLHASEVERLPDQAGSLWADAQPDGEAFTQTLERLTIRLGPERVVRPQLRADHRPGHMQTWVSATEPPSRAARGTPTHPAATHQLPLPAWLLDEPLPLSQRDERPLYHGPLTLLAGPHRIESGWWDTRLSGRQARDYFVARSSMAGLLWVFRERLPGDEAPTTQAANWYLHGLYG